MSREGDVLPGSARTLLLATCLASGLSDVGIGSLPKAYAQAGTSCPEVVDRDRGAADGGLLVLRNDPAGCFEILSRPITQVAGPGGGPDINIFIFTNGGTQLGLEHGPNVTNVISPGFPNPDGGLISLGADTAAATAASFTTTVQYDFNGQTFHFTIHKQPMTDRIAPFTVQAGPVTPAAQVQRTVANFLARRADQIVANEPDLIERLTRRNSASGNGPIGFTAAGTGTNAQFGFSTSLRQIANADAASKARRQGTLMGLGAEQRHSEDAAQRNNGFDIWVKGKAVRIDSASAESDLGLLYVGADYRLNSSLLVGLLAQFDFTDETDTVQQTSVEGDGFLVGPYIAARLSPFLYFDARVAYGTSDNEVQASATSRGSFDGKRWLARARLTGEFHVGDLTIAPLVGVTYFEEKQESFTDSSGTVIPSQTVSLGRINFGPTFRANFGQEDGSVISPHIRFQGIWDFDQSDIVDTSTGLALGSDDFRARIDGGLTYTTADGVTWSAEGFFDGIGADNFEAFGGGLAVRIPLN